MYGESNMGTYITICKTDSKWEVAVCFRELKQGLCTKLKVWDGGRNGREVQEEGDICIPMADSMLRFDRKQQNSEGNYPSVKK